MDAAKATGCAVLLLVAAGPALAQPPAKVAASVRFDQKLRDWDGCGVNYVELAQSIDYRKDPQEYGGFSRLSAAERQEILELVFGADGLKPGVLKMFFDPFHQAAPGAPFDHETTTKWMRHFVREGLKRGRADGRELPIVTTLYGPPPWATKQKFLRGRDLDPAQYRNLALYMVDWVKWLREKEGFPVRYLSLHNEGDSPYRWPLDGASGNIGGGHDYNAFWRPQEVASFIALLRPLFDENGLRDVGITPGECSNWRNFSSMLYDWAIFDSPEALASLGLVTSHGFGAPEVIIPTGNDLLRFKRPDLHSWTTSYSWGTMDVRFLELSRQNIYNAKVNALIPWAFIQTLTWVGGDPNPGCAIRVSEDGSYTVLPGYYFYKQLSRAGQPGMAVATVTTTSGSDVELIGFASNGTKHPDAVVVLNNGRSPSRVRLSVQGTPARAFRGFRTTRNAEEKYASFGRLELKDGEVELELPGGAVATLFGE
jgi:O-glycosyl hydrolase